MKTRTLLIAAVMFLAMTVASFAQATLSVGSIPVTAVINTGQVEQTGTVTFTWVSGTTSVGTITINYGVPITYPDLLNNPGGITITPTGSFIGSAPTVNTTASNNALGLLVLNVVGGPAAAGSFSVTGIRVAVANSGLTSLTANLSAVGNAITAGQTSVVVISAIQPGIAAVGTKSPTTGGPAPIVGSINAVSGVVTASPVVTVKEGFLNAFGAQSSLTNAGVAITLSAAPSAGVSVTFPNAAVSYSGATAFDGWQLMNSDGSLATGTLKITSSSTSLTAYYRQVSISDPTTAEFLQVSPTLSVSSTATLPLTPQTVTYSVSLAPIGGVFNSDGSIIVGNLIPRYVNQSAGSATLYNITGLTTGLLVPFAQTVTALGYNTGFAISNSTLDPGASALGIATAATVQSGTVTFYFFPQLAAGGTALPTITPYVTKAGSPGSGLDASGRVLAGSTYSVLLSQLLAAAGAPADFTGYVIAVANFTNAHGFWTISNFTTFSQGGAMMVLPNDRTVTPEALNN